MKRFLIGLLVVGVLGVVVVASIVRGSGRGQGERVYTHAVERDDITQIVKATGAIDPRVKVNISAHVVGKIARLYVEEGQAVAAGQPFLQLEKEAFLAVVERARAQLQIARSRQRQAEVDLADAEVKLRRATRLAGEGILSAEELEAAQLRRSSAELGLDQAREEVTRSAADLEKAEDDLAKTTLFAPLSGRVITLSAEQGEVVVSGTMNNPGSVIGTVADLSEILAVVDVDETEIVDVAVGENATVKVDAMPDSEYRGRVVEIGSSGFARAAQPDVTFFKVKILLDDAPQELLPGMSARADIEVATHRDTLVAPIEAVVYRKPHDATGEEDVEPKEEAGAPEEVQVVFVVAAGKAVERPVELGLTDSTRVEITSGVAEGDAVVTGPFRTLKELHHDDAVQPREREEDAEDA